MSVKGNVGFTFFVLGLSYHNCLDGGRCVWPLIYYVSSEGYRKVRCMRSRQVWKYLIGIFAVFWVVLAIMFVIADFPFYIITLSLSIMLILSAAIVVLAWAWTHDY
jgi:hypothetical protein